MTHSAKVFINGRSQAVRLPAAFRFDCIEVYIRKNEQTGEIILSKKPDSWEGFFELLKTVKVPEEFMQDRDNDLPQERDIFNE